MTQTFEKALYLISWMNLKSWFIVCHTNSVSKVNKPHIFLKKALIYYSQLSNVFLILKLNIQELQNIAFKNAFECTNKISYWLH